MLRNIIGPSFESKNGNLCLPFCSFFLKISFSLEKEDDFEQIAKERKIGPSFDSKKASLGPSFDYIYI